MLRLTVTALSALMFTLQLVGLSLYINLYLPEKRVLQSAAFIAMYLAVICAFEPVPFRKIMTAPLLHTYKCPDSVLKCFHDIISGIGMWKIWYEFLW